MKANIHFLIIFRSVLLRIKNVSEKCRRRNQNTHFTRTFDNCLPKFILVINQLDAQNFCFTSLFHASTCFGHHVLIISRSKLYYTSSGIVTHIGVMIPEVV